MNALGTAVRSPLSIAWTTPTGALWLNRQVLVHPKFEVGLKVTINAHGCYDDNFNNPMDGWTIILSKTNNYIGQSGDNKGYNGIYDAIVTEFDFHYNYEAGDISGNSVSIHKCFQSNCSPIENSNTIQRNIAQTYDRCQVMSYDIVLLYNNGNYRIQLGDSYIVDTTEDLNERFSGWAFLGFSGFFQGQRRELQIFGSYFCEDDYTLSFDYKYQYSSAWFISKAVTVPAGSSFNIYVHSSII